MNTLNDEYLRSLTSSCYPNWDGNLFQQIIDLLEIPLNKKFNKLSQGLQRKLLLALTIASNTSLMILDEPTAYLDIPAKKNLGDLLIDWMDNGKQAIIMTNHQVEDIRKLSDFTDFICILDNGKMIGNFDKSQLRERYKTLLV